MADISVTHLGDISASGASSASGGSGFTTGVNKYYTAHVRGRDNGGNPNTPTMSGWGLTWTLEESQESSGSGCWLFRAVGTPTGGNLTVDFAGQGISTIYCCVNEWTNVAMTGTNGSDGIRQSVPIETGNATGLTITLAALGNSKNVNVGFLVQRNTIQTLTVGSGQTALDNQGFDGDDSWLVQYKVNTVTSDCTSSGESAWIGIAAEMVFRDNSANASILLLLAEFLIFIGSIPTLIANIFSLNLQKVSYE